MQVLSSNKLQQLLIYLSLLTLLLLFLLPPVFARSFGGNVSSHISNAIKKQVKAAIVPTLKTKKNKIEYPEKMLVSKDKRYLALSMEGGYVSIWDMEKGNEVDHFNLKSMILKDITIDHQRKKIYLIDKKGLLFVKPLVAGEDFKALNKLQKNNHFSAVRVNAKNLLLSTVNNELLLFDRKNEPELLTKIRLPSSIDAIEISDKSNQILVATHDKTLALYQLSKNKLIRSQSWILANGAKRVFFNQNGTAFALQFNNDQYAYSTTKVSNNNAGFQAIKTVKQTVLVIDFSNDVLNVLTKNNKTYQQNVKTGRISKTKQLKELKTQLVRFYKNGRYLLVPKRQGGILLVDVKSDTKVAQLISTKSGWAVLDKQGRYDGDEDAFHDVSWEADGQLLELDQFSDKYFEPGLLEKVIAGEPQMMITKPEAQIEKGLYLPPEVFVKILTREENFKLPGKIELAIMAKVEGQADDLHSLSVYHNGKKIPQSRLQLKKTYQEGNKGVKKWSLVVQPVEGLNGFNVEVKGWENIAGQSQQVIFTAKQMAAAKASRVFMNSIGINEYQGKELALDFAVSDAQEIFKTFSTSTLGKTSVNQNQQNGLVRTLILNKQASKKSIVSLFEQTKKQSNQNDMLVVFMSGHGIVVENKWYFLPQETKTLRDAGHIRSVGLSAKEMMDKFVEIPSQKIVLIIDACQSGAVTDEFNNFHQRRALRGLSRDTGIHIIAATRADQLAPEFGELGHGLFTYTLLNGMKNNSQGFYNADQWPKDGQLMVSELQKYAEKFVPALAHAMASRHYASSGERGGLDERTIITPVGSSQGRDFVIYQ